MTEVEVADRLRALLVALDSEATALSPGRSVLEDVLFSHQRAPRIEGPYALITSLGFRDAGEMEFSCYDEVQIGPDLRVVENAYRVLEYGFRVDLYAQHAADLVRLFATALRSGRAQTDLAPMMVRSVTRAGMEPELVQQHWEDRANFTVIIAVRTFDAMLVDVIESGTIAFEGDGATARTETRPFQKD